MGKSVPQHKILSSEEQIMGKSVPQHKILSSEEQIKVKSVPQVIDFPSGVTVY